MAEPTLSFWSGLIGKVLGDAFIRSHKRRISLDELNTRTQKLATENEDLRLTAELNAQRIQFTEMVLANLIASGRFQSDSHYLRLDVHTAPVEIPSIIAGALQESDTQGHAELVRFDASGAATTGPTTTSEVSSQNPARLLFEGFNEELEERRHRAGR
jgi:hypothetical protein